jgi:hypothetical protein
MGEVLFLPLKMHATGLSACRLCTPGGWNSGAPVHPRLIISRCDQYHAFLQGQLGVGTTVAAFTINRLF